MIIFIDGSFLSFKINGKNPPPELLLTDFKHTLSDEMLHKAEFTFDNTDGRLENAELRKYILNGNKYEFIYGYLKGKTSRKFTYEVKGISGFLSVTITLYPVITNMEKPFNRVFKQKKVSDIARLMAKEMGLKDDFIQDTKEIYKSLKQNDESNPKWLKRHASKLAWEFGVDGKYLIFRQRQYKKNPEYTFIYGDPKYNNAILEFEPEEQTLGVPSKVDNTFMDQGTGKPVNINANNKTVKRDVLGGSKTLITGAAEGEKAKGILTHDKVAKVNRKTLEQYVTD